MKADDIRTVAIVGAGVMGPGMAMTFAQAAYTTILRDVSEEQLEKSRNTISTGRFGWENAIARGKLTRAQVTEFATHISYTTHIEDLAGADLVIEAVPEDEDIKKTVLSELDRVVKPEAIFATNTSGYAIATLNHVIERRDRFIGMHWFSPANIMRIIELIYAPETSEETLTTMEDVCARIGKTSVRVKDAPGSYGFIANRVYFAAVAEARKIVESGIASAEDVDTAMKLGYNWPAGPLEMAQGKQSGWE